MFRLILFIVIAICVALTAVWFANHPGLVILEWQGRRVEMTVGIFLVILLVLAAAAVLLVELLRLLFSAPGRWRRRNQRNRELRGYRELSRGLVAAAAGDVRALKLHSRQAERLIGHEPAVQLLSAQSAQLDGDEEHALLTYRRMLARPETEFLGLRSLLGEAIKAGDREEALALARRAYRENPEAPWTASTLFDLLTKQALWVEALEVVNTLQNNKTITVATARRRRAVLQYLVGRDKRADRSLDAAIDAARRSARLMPTFTPAQVLRAAALFETNQPGRARRVIERAWEVRPHPELAQAYANLVPEETAAERLRRFERLARRHPTHIETRITMANLALTAGQVETARDNLSPVLAHEPTARACRLMSDIEKAAGASEDTVEGWLAQAINARQDLAWVCEDTGDVLQAWQPFGTSGRFDVVRWTTPPTFIPLAQHDDTALALSENLTPLESTTGASDQPSPPAAATADKRPAGGSGEPKPASTAEAKEARHEPVA